LILRPERVLSNGATDALLRFPVRTPTLPPATHTNSYALGTREILLVEPATPYEDEQRAFSEWIAALRGQGRVLVGVLLTHHHMDHVGALPLAGGLGVPVYMHEETRSRVPAVPNVHIVRDGEQLTLDGQTPQVWDVLHTPGHAAGHLCLHERALGVVIAGDMVASEGTILIAPDEGDMGEYCTQLARLDALGAQMVLPAHGAPIHQSVCDSVFERTRLHRLRREAKVVDALAQCNGGTLDELVRVAYADTPEPLWPLARLSLEAHLIKLERDGVAQRVGPAWLHFKCKVGSL
jgi:endoribonuclease LACTB2